MRLRCPRAIRVTDRFMGGDLPLPDLNEEQQQVVAALIAFIEAMEGKDPSVEVIMKAVLLSVMLRDQELLAEYLKGYTEGLLVSFMEGKI